jgi:glyceraldehyde 3-phosphate dehydrogenase
MRVAINGFGRMGRLANEPNASAETMGLLLEFDSVQGRWSRDCANLRIDGRQLAYSREGGPPAWEGVDLVLECSGQYKTAAALQAHGCRVVVAHAVKDIAANIVVGVNDGNFDLAREPIVTAASCTTNCLAPIVRVLHDGIGIERGTVTTIHDPTNTQRVHDAPHSDPRRARAAQLNLIPTSSNSSYAVTLIIPELAGRLESLAVRVPVLNASLTDCVFSMRRDTSVEEVNALLAEAAAQPPLQDILGYEERPLVSSDYRGDPRSGIVDALSTRVTDGRLVKVLAWYDNEWGYANRLVELARMVARG